MAAARARQKEGWHGWGKMVDEKEKRSSLSLLFDVSPGHPRRIRSKYTFLPTCLRAALVMVRFGP